MSITLNWANYTVNQQSMSSHFDWTFRTVLNVGEGDNTDPGSVFEDIGHNQVFIHTAKYKDILFSFQCPSNSPFGARQIWCSVKVLPCRTRAYPKIEQSLYGKNTIKVYYYYRSCKVFCDNVVNHKKSSSSSLSHRRPHYFFEEIKFFEKKHVHHQNSLLFFENSLSKK